MVQKTVGLMGSLGYLSPEQLEGARTASPASDQYGLGIILYECVTGRPPFPGDDVTKIFGDILKGRRPPADELRPGLPEGLQHIIDRATSRDPATRFPSVRAMGKELLAFATPKAALTWASTFNEASDVIPPLPIPRPVFRALDRRGAGGSRAQRSGGGTHVDRVGCAVAAHDRDATGGDAAHDAAADRDSGRDARPARDAGSPVDKSFADGTEHHSQRNR